MEKINTDYKRQIWKIEAKLSNVRKPWLISFNARDLKLGHFDIFNVL